MKKFLTCALCFVPNLVMARTLYYTPGGECPGLYLNPATTGCPGDSDRVVKLNVAKRADATFSGYKIGDVEIVDSAGNVKENAVNTLVAARTAGTITDAAKISGYECNQGIYGSNKNVQKNENGTCVVEDSDEDSGVEYIRGDGTPELPSNVNCWRNGKNYCYWNVKVVFHDKPSGIANFPTIRTGNDGLVLKCDSGAGCRIGQGSAKNCCTPDTGTLTPDVAPTCNTAYVQNPPSGAQAACQSISTPYADGYTFRGYFLNNSNNIVVQQTDMTNSAFSNFFPKNLNNRTISVTGHTVVIVDTKEVPIVCDGNWVSRPDGSQYCDGKQTTAEYTVDVYGGWARDCTPGDNATCDLQTGKNWNPSNGLKKGNARYNTGCADGYVISGGAGTYKPICETEKGEDLTINYTFRDQFGNPATCNGPTGVCTLADTYNLIGSTAVQTACGNDYTLKYLVTGGVNGGWHRPGKNVSCGTNEFGTNRPASVVGTVCKNVCTIGQHYNDLHATCVQMVNGPSLGNLPTPTYMTNGGYYVIDTYNVENLWDGCPTLQCDSGYTLKMNNNGPYCEQDYKPDALECPSGLTPPDGVTVGTPVNTGSQCQYEIECSDSGAVLEHPNPSTVSPTARGGILVCNGTSGCTQSQVQSALNQYSCFKCPSSGFGYDTNLTVGMPTVSPAGLASNHSCEYNVYCRDGVYSPDDILGTVTCHSNTEPLCMTPMGPTYAYPIANLINAYASYCEETPTLQNCPTMVGNTGGPEGNPSSWGTVNVAMTGTPASGCTYTLSCANNYTLVKQSGNSYPPVGGGTATVSCSGNGCTAESLSSRILEYYCAVPDAGKGPGDLQPAFTIDENLTEETN